jgi:hypothetical protein
MAMANPSSDKPSKFLLMMLYPSLSSLCLTVGAPLCQHVHHDFQKIYEDGERRRNLRCAASWSDGGANAYVSWIAYPLDELIRLGFAGARQ